MRALEGGGGKRRGVDGERERERGRRAGGLCTLCSGLLCAPMALWVAMQLTHHMPACPPPPTHQAAQHDLAEVQREVQYLTSKLSEARSDLAGTSARMAVRTPRPNPPRMPPWELVRAGEGLLTLPACCRCACQWWQWPTSGACRPGNGGSAS